MKIYHPYGVRKRESNLFFYRYATSKELYISHIIHLCNNNVTPAGFVQNLASEFKSPAYDIVVNPLHQV